MNSLRKSYTHNPKKFPNLKIMSTYEAELETDIMHKID